MTATTTATIRRLPSGNRIAILPNRAPVGTLIQHDGRTYRTTQRAHVRSKGRFSEYRAPVELYATRPVYSVLSPSQLDANPGDVITGDVTGRDAPIRARVVSVSARRIPVFEGSAAYYASTYEVVEAEHKAVAA